MKRHPLRRYGFALCATTLGMGILIACGDDGVVILATPDSGSDGRVPDATPVPGKDVVTTDVVTIVEAGNDVDVDPPDAADGGSSADGDAGEQKDAQADVEIPPIDAGSADADAGDLAKDFPGRVATEFCRTTARCCFNNADLGDGGAVDGGGYNGGKCYNTYSNLGIDQSSPGSTADFSKITYDRDKAAECLGRIKVLSCGANAAEYRAMVQSCYAALVGTGGAGAACKLSSECQKNFFCNTSVAGGTCEAIRATGAVCGDWTTSAGPSQQSCSNRISGDPSRFCRNRDDAGTLLPTASWMCSDPLPPSSRCSNNGWCDNNNVCAFNPATSSSACQPFIALFTNASCGTFVSP